MLRFKLGQLGLAVMAVGVALAALVRATPAWVSLIYTASLAAFTAAALAGLFAPRRRRPFWAGAALTALTYVVAARSFAPPLEAAPARAIRTWAEGSGSIAYSNPFLTAPSNPMPTITASPAPAFGTSFVDTLLDGAAIQAPPATTDVATAPPAIVPSGPGPATLRQAAASRANVYDPIWVYVNPPPRPPRPAGRGAMPG